MNISVSNGMVRGMPCRPLRFHCPLGSMTALVDLRSIVTQVRHAPDHEVPAVLFVHGEGFVSVGIKRLAGRVAWLS